MTTRDNTRDHTSDKAPANDSVKARQRIVTFSRLRAATVNKAKLRDLLKRSLLELA